MQKLAPSPGRLATIAVFALSCFGLLLFLWLSFGGTVPLEAKGYRFNIIFPQANQLAVQADVRISGVPVGTVVTLNPTPNGETIATIQMQPRYSPVHTDATAILRAKTLLGETFVALNPGSHSAPAIPEGGTLARTQVAPSVQLDEIYRTFDPQTRAAFQTWIVSQAAGVNGQGAALNAALGELDPFVNDLEQVTATLQSQNGAVAALVRNTGIVFDALAQRNNQLRDLVTASHATFGATAAASNELAAAFTLLPTFEQRSQAAFRRLDAFAANTSPLLTQLAPAEVALTPVLRNLEKLSPSLERLFVGLGPFTQASKPGLPAFDNVLAQLRPLLGAFSPVLRNLIPLIAYAEGYQPEIESFLANTAASFQASTTIGADLTTPPAQPNPSITTVLHYARVLTGPAHAVELRAAVAAVRHDPGQRVPRLRRVQPDRQRPADAQSRPPAPTRRRGSADQRTTASRSRHSGSSWPSGSRGRALTGTSPPRRASARARLVPGPVGHLPARRRAAELSARSRAASALAALEHERLQRAPHRAGHVVQPALGHRRAAGIDVACSERIPIHSPRGGAMQLDRQVGVDEHETLPGHAARRRRCRSPPWRRAAAAASSPRRRRAPGAGASTVRRGRAPSPPSSQRISIAAPKPASAESSSVKLPAFPAPVATVAGRRRRRPRRG